MSSKPLILDVRSTAEFSIGHAPGSLNIPLPELANRLSELDPGRPIHACCAGGGRSAMAMSILKTSGFQKVRDVGAWQTAQLLAARAEDPDEDTAI